ncbi:response regulator transcription factor [Sphingomonas crusticola]|uniref:response regulator transcription factor n=1 Tax=Sphingomonas crusticola TaxID=1697973 RepID=UPI000E28283E|nr:response regulator transcription factor [Sphingomonas crusticola]
MTTTPFRLLIIDDHPVLLYGLRLLLDGSACFAICAEATTAADALAQAEAHQPDFIIADLVMGGRDGISMIEDLTTVSRARILVYSSHDELTYAQLSIRAGAKGYISKNEPLSNVEQALHLIAGGDIAVAPKVQAQLMREIGGGMPRAEGVAALSMRERQVLALIADGLDLAAISRTLSLSPKTVGTYRDRLKIKLGLDSLRALERFADNVSADRLRQPS